MSLHEEIPLVDFRPFLSGDTDDRKRVASAIDRALSSTGFIYLSNHGIDQKRVEECFSWNKQFFELPEATRNSLRYRANNSIRGYVAVGEEIIRHRVSIKECFDYGNPDDPEARNVWPPEEELPGFRAFMEGFYQDCKNLVYALLDCLSLALNLEDANSLRRHHTKSLFDLTLTHYPSLPVKRDLRGDALRLPAHSDLGSITLLFQDDIGGLEVADLSSADATSSAEFERKGRFQRVEPKAGTVIVNIGYLLMRWSNGRWKNTVHRVVEPPTGVTGQVLETFETEQAQCGGNEDDSATPQDRYSIPFFASPDRETIIEALPGCWSENEPKKWKPIHVGDYLLRKRKEVYP